MGYVRVRDFDGGIAEWTGAGLPVEKGDAPAPAAVPSAAGSRAPEAPLPSRGVAPLLSAWLAINLALGLVYWLISYLPGHGLREQGLPLGHGAAELLEAVYFSFVTGLSIGFGDIVPVGLVRVLAVLQGAACLLIFGVIISKLVSRRQDELIAEIHRIAFEDRLGRVRTNLHLVVKEIQEIAELCRDGSAPSSAVVTRIESAAAIFAGELRAVHDLLYRPQTAPGEDVLESILAHLDGGLREFGSLLACIAPDRRDSAALATNLRTIAGLAEEICGDCVPREHAPDLKLWMDRIQGRARGLGVARV